MRLVPVGRAQVELGDDLGFAALQFAEQELAEQRVVAVPLSAAVERSHEQAPGLQFAEHRLRAGPLEDGIAQGTRQLIEHGRSSQEPLQSVGQAGERLPVEVVGHVAILTTHVPDLEPAVPRHQGREVQARRPPLGPSDHRGGGLEGQVDPCIREDLPRAGRVEGEILRPDLQHVPRRAEPGHVGLLGATRRDELRSGTQTRDGDAQHVVAALRAHLVEIVQHHDERRRGGMERGGQTRRGAAQRRAPETAHVLDQSRCSGHRPLVRRCEQSQQGCGIVIERVKRCPCDRTIFGLRPLSEQGRFPVPGGRGHGDHGALARSSGSDQGASTHGARASSRDRDLGVEERPANRSRE